MKEISTKSTGKLSTAEKLENAIRELSLQKEHNRKLEHTYKLAEIGTWDFDLDEQDLYWSRFIKTLHEVPGNFKPDLDTAFEFYKDGWSRETITEAIADAIAHGTSFDLELIMITAKGKEKWVRALGLPVMHNGVCKRINGSIQDITIRKTTELELKKSNSSLKERVKEQDCLYRISNINEQELSIEELLSKAVKLIPSGFQFNEIAEAKITWKDQAFKTDNFGNSKIKLTESDDRFGKKALQVEVQYVDSSQLIEGLSFLKEEKQLLKAITNQLSQKIDQIIKRDEIKVVQEILTKSNRLSAFISAINQMIVKTKDEASLFNQACNIAVDIGMFKMAWIGRIDEATKKVIPLDRAGKEDDYLTKITPISIDDIPGGRGPTGTSLREGKYIVSNDIENHPQMVPWKEACIERGYLSGIAFPLKKIGKVVALYSLYAPVKNFFDNAEIALLQETADNISYALESIEKAEQQKKVEKEIQDYKFALDESSLVDISDGNGKIKYTNENFCKLSKYSQDELIGQDHRILNSGYHPTELFRNLWTTVKAGKIWRNEVRNRAKDGSFFWVDTTIVPFLDRAGNPFQFITIRTDITERKRAEEKLIDSYALSRKAGEIAKLGGWNVNLEENRVYWSDEVAAIHEMPAGYGPLVEEGINFYAPEWREKITEVFTNCAQKGIAYDEDMEILTSSGKRVWVRTNGEAVRDNYGKIVKVQGAFQDITERKHTEKALQLTQFAFDNASDAIFWMSPDARIVNVNEAACVSLGYTQQELLSLSIPDIDPDFNIETWADFFPELRKKRSLSIETNHLRKDGSLLSVEIRSNYIKFGDKEFSCAFVRDITERKIAEEALKESEEKFKNAVMNAPFPIMIHSENGEVILINDTWQEKTGYLHQEIPTIERWTELAYGEKKNVIKEEINQLFELDKRKREGEYEIATRSGEKRIWDFSSAPIGQSSENQRLVISMALDITERKLAEEALIESEKEVRAIAESMPQIVWVTTTDGKKIYFNHQWVEYTGLRLEQSYGDGLLIPFHEDDKPIAVEAWSNAVEKQSEFSVESRLRKYDGTYRWWLIRGVPKINEKGEILKWYGTCTDIEIIKQTEIEHTKIADDLLHRNQDLEQFAYMISHNLRAPVANIKGLSGILGDESLTIDEVDSVRKYLLSSVSNLDTVILDLNNILQVKKGLSEAKERVVFAELVNGIKELIQSLLLTEKVKIETHFDEVAEMTTLKSYLYSIFYNLISNSIKYKREDVHPIIEIKSLQRKDKIELIFKDNGRGIDLERNGDEVFGLYKRFHRNIEGKGLGLFMVKAQVEALGGKISVESKVNKGTTFKIVFGNTI